MTFQRPGTTRTVEFDVGWSEILAHDFSKAVSKSPANNRERNNRQIFLDTDRLLGKEKDIQEFASSNTLVYTMFARLDITTFAYRTERTLLGVGFQFEDEMQAVIFKLYAS